MNCLIIYAHPHPHSFNHELLQAVERKLTSMGVSVLVRDLYAHNFNPNYGIADLEAARRGAVLPDVCAEQKLLNDADRVIFVSPTWHDMPPLMLKGYIDRVFTSDFGVRSLGHSVSLLNGKKFGMFNTSVSVKADTLHHGSTDLHHRLMSHGIFKAIGSPLSFHHVFYNVEEADDKSRSRMLGESARIAEHFVCDDVTAQYIG
jgi:NAD(P)H dehydrogenase (quinone)